MEKMKDIGENKLARDYYRDMGSFEIQELKKKKKKKGPLQKHCWCAQEKEENAKLLIAVMNAIVQDEEPGRGLSMLLVVNIFQSS